LQRYVVRRVAALAVTLLFVSLLVFVVVRVLPGDPALVILGLEASPDSVARVRQALGLDQPIPVQYARWVGRALRGDLETIVGKALKKDPAQRSQTMTDVRIYLDELVSDSASGRLSSAARPSG